MIQQHIQYNNVIINAIQTKVIKYENPATIETTYEIEFETPTGIHFKIGPKTIEDIVMELRSKGMVYKIKMAEEALTALLNAYHRENKIIIRTELETPGFYLENAKITSYKTEQKEVSHKDIMECARILDDLSARFKRKDVFATVIKWAIISPFSYVLKQIEHEDRWLQWLYLYGWTNTGKTTVGRIALSIWRKHNDRRKHDIGFSNVDNIARFGRAVSYNTYPVLINEVQLNDERQKQLVEALKHAVQSQTARARLKTKSTAEYIAALSACMLTSNSAPPEDPAFQRRVIPIHFSQEDEPNPEEREGFKEFLKNNIDRLGTLGDFAANYILNNQDTIFKSEWNDAATEILKAFFGEAQMEAPEWVNDFVQETSVQDHAQQQEQFVRGFMIKLVNETYSRNFRVMASRTDQEIENNNFENRLVFCLDRDLISFLKRKDGYVLILHDILKEMRSQKITYISTLTELGRMLQGEVKPAKMGDKTIRPVIIPINKFIEFLLPPFP
jgi:hypothetical protein